MADLFWPGDHRAGGHFTADDLVAQMVAVEQDWLHRLVAHGVAPATAEPALAGLLGPSDIEVLALDAESGGNPVIPLVDRLRAALEPEHAEAARWLHRGLTSQDVLDSALMRMATASRTDLVIGLEAVAADLADLAEKHRETPMVARTLGRPAIPTTFGFRVAQWLTAVLEAREDVERLSLPEQYGGAAGTRAAMVELGVQPGEPLPWHTTRAPITRLGDALVGCTDACARIANDVLTMSRPETGELTEGSAGRSSTMPHKANPTLSVLVRRAALTTPQLAATLHLAAAAQVDDRADGGWHAEWATLRDLTRRALTAVGQTADLVAGLVVHVDRMAENLAAAGDAVLTEQRAIAGLVGREPAAGYLGQSARIVDAVVVRARTAPTDPRRPEEES